MEPSLTPRKENPLYDARYAYTSEADLHKLKFRCDAAVRQRIDFELVHRKLQKRKQHGTG